LLGLFDVTYAFQNCIWVVYIVWHTFTLMLSQILLWNALEISNKLNKIWLKWLNLPISKYEWLNWSKVLKLTNSLKVKGVKTWYNFVFFSLNFLNQTKVFSSKLKFWIIMVCFVGVINIILVSIFNEKLLLYFKKFNEKDQIASISLKLEPNWN